MSQAKRWRRARRFTGPRSGCRSMPSGSQCLETLIKVARPERPGFQPVEGIVRASRDRRQEGCVRVLRVPQSFDAPVGSRAGPTDIAQGSASYLICAAPDITQEELIYDE